MSLFGSLYTAVSGLGAQSAAFSNISDNVANSQSTGFKRTDTGFIDYLTTSNATENIAGSVGTRPIYENNVQGNIVQTDNPLSLAISQQGFFAVSETTGTVNGQPVFSSQPYYTRAGDFTLNQYGYLVNSEGQYLNGWNVDPTTGVASQKAVYPIKVDESSLQPIQTSKVDIAANLPATPVSGTAVPGSPISATIQVYDTVGAAHTVTLDWQQVMDTQSPPQAIPNQWTLSIYNGSDTSSSNLLESTNITFGGQDSAGSQVPAGTISQLSNPVDANGAPVTDNNGNTLTASTALIGKTATVPFAVTFPGSPQQTINLNLGTFGGTGGVTQYAGSTYSMHGMDQDGQPPGNYAGVTLQDDGSVVVNYDNGKSRPVAQIPLITFNAPDALQRQNGQSFTATVDSGTPNANIANTNGAGTFVVGAYESSNVSIATEFAKLIGAQQAYSANAKIVTTDDQLLQVTLNMKS